VCYAAAKGQRFECPQTACKQPLSDASRCGWPPGDLLFPLAVVAAALALLVPSKPLAERSDWILAALVLFTALGIAPSQLATLGERKLALAALVLAPFALLAPLAWAVSRVLAEPVREGVLALGVSSTEVAVVGPVALGSGGAVLAVSAYRVAGRLGARRAPRS
jgi:hypothetical protein